MPMRQMRCGGCPVMSRPSSRTRPPSAGRCPVIRLKKVDFPAPFGPMTAAIWRVSTVRLTSLTATKPAKLLLRERTSSIARRQIMPQAAEAGDKPADDAAGECEQQHQQDHAEDERPILRVVGDLLVEPDEGQRPDRRAPEKFDAAEDRHDDDLGGFRPEHIVGEDAAAENAVQRAGESGKAAGD